MRPMSKVLEKILSEKISKNLDLAEAINRKLIQQALAGESWAIKLIYEYMDGKPTDSIDRSTDKAIAVNLAMKALSQDEVSLLTKQAQEILEYHQVKPLKSAKKAKNAKTVPKKVK